MELVLSNKQLQSVEPVYEAADRLREAVESVVISGNHLSSLSQDFYLKLSGLVEIDVSDNRLKTIADGIAQLRHLRVFDARNNQLSSLPKDFSDCQSLAEVNLGGNFFERFPSQLCEMPAVEKLWLGSNRLTSIPSEIAEMKGLQVLFLGGNRLTSLPSEISHLSSLQSLSVCHNSLKQLPPSVTSMKSLRSIQLHSNRVETLPTSLLHMTQLREISLRNNPLVVRFVRDYVDEVPSLLELAARRVKLSGVSYGPTDLPPFLITHLDNAQHCDNPRCHGVYFHTVFRQVKFVDFCGKYRVPFMHFLCSPECRAMAPGHTSAWSSSSEDEEADEMRRMKKVLLG